jgi:peptidoglycan/LPS O-acetylase OafA/YrhL
MWVDGIGRRRSIIGDVWTRWLALAATIWTGAYLVVYLALVRHDGNPPAWWYVGLVAVGMVASVAVVAGWLSRLALAASAAVLALAALLGLLSIGIFLLPSVMCVSVAAVIMKSRPGRPASDD